MNESFDFLERWIAKAKPSSTMRDLKEYYYLDDSNYIANLAGDMTEILRLAKVGKMYEDLMSLEKIENQIQEQLDEIRDQEI